MTTIFDWTSLVRTSADKAQFHDAPFLRGQAFSLGGDVAPSVQVFFQPVTNAQTAPIAFLGIYVEEFERSWLDRLRKTASSSEAPQEDPPFVTLADNVASLRPRPWAPPQSPSGEDVAAMQDWFGRVFAYAKRLPSSMPDLIGAIAEDNIDGEALWAYFGHPVKVRGFVEWMRRTRGVNVAAKMLRQLEDRTDPYDVAAMLDDPSA